jgi:hypothetical protein
VTPSPGTASELVLPTGVKVVDFDVWSGGPEAAILVREANGKYRVLAWRIGSRDAPPVLELPAGFEPGAIAGHPAARRLFLAGRANGQSIVLMAQPASGAWTTRQIHQTSREIRRLLVGPRPFQIGYAEDQSYRLFFAERLPDGAYSTRSINEEGKREYQVVGPKSSYQTVPGAEEQPRLVIAASALPASFHPAGHILIWQDPHGCFQQLAYNRDTWGRTSLVAGNLCGGSLTVTPNGASLLHWERGHPGVTVIADGGRTKIPQAAGYNFVSTPSSVPDGKGVVGLVEKPEGQALVYVPISVPLADVVNAWMFSEDGSDQQLFTAHAGLFRPLRGEQLYQLYDSEAYYCGGYDHTTPTRPYLVTTDILWELVAAAYEGTFIIQERQQAIPAFWSFVDAARAALLARSASSPWAEAFVAVAGLHSGTAAPDSETARIASAAGRAFSPTFGRDFDYSEVRPRGHYNSTPEMAAYFKAVHYLTQLADVRDAAALNSLPADARAKAMRWIAAYLPYIAPSRAPLVWSRQAFSPPPYARHPAKKAQIFPLSWGFDNEILLATVYHRDWPEPEQIKGEHRNRLLPSGLDLAAALGSGLARSLLKTELREYPTLGPVLDALNGRWRSSGAAGTTVYSAWISALATQWADDVAFPGAPADNTLWKTKRLQTGLASWATLRHATVLVNERTTAECGEGGFEQIVLAPPRGYVEPDPETFGAIARLFEQMEQTVTGPGVFSAGTMPGGDSRSNEPLRQGLLRRLRESAAKARLFRSMAEKEIRGEELTEKEYEEILYVGRVAEHHLLVFKSLANKDLALSNPDPMMKVADVAGGRPVSAVLEAAVGRPLEWDQVVPYYGRRQIVKGSVYSYYEFTSPSPMDDSEWRRNVDRQQRPAWISGFLSSWELSCPAKAPF